MGRRKYTDEQLRLAVTRSRNMRELLISLGLAPRGGNYESMWQRLRGLGIDATHLTVSTRLGRALRSCTDEEIAAALAQSRSLAGVLRSLGVRLGGNQQRLRVRIEQVGLDTSHLVGAGWRRGSTDPVVPAKPIEQVLVKGKRTHTNDLKLRLLREGLKKRACEGCGLDRWMGKPIPLELEHVNGRRDDNRLRNLKLLCPNCHALTPTYRGRNIGRAEALS
jgi:hypothetical protein